MNLRDFVIDYCLRASTGAAVSRAPAKSEDIVLDAINLWNEIQLQLPEVPSDKVKKDGKRISTKLSTA